MTKAITISSMLSTLKTYALFSLALALLTAAPNILAQSFSSDTHPNNNPIELPDFPAEQAISGSILPSLALPQTFSKTALYTGKTFMLRGVEFSGNTVFSDKHLSELVSNYLNTKIDLPVLQALRDRITQEYVTQGYVNSGALLPDQTVDNGIVQINIVEGMLSDIILKNDGKLKERFFTERLALAADPAVNIHKLEQRLFSFQQDERIKKITAELKPGRIAGQSVLNVSVNENPSFSAYTEINNYHTPGVGAEGIYLNLRNNNLLGNGETLSLGFEATQGLTAANANYTWFLNSADTSLQVLAEISDAEVVTEDFDTLNIESRSQTLGLTLTHPFYRDSYKSFRVFAGTELRESESFLLGEGFSFTEGPENGLSRLSILRTGIDYQSGTATRVVATRATVSMGADAFDATIHDDDRPDGEFISVLLQAQWAQRLSLWQSTIIARFDMQLSDAPLLSLEQFAIGGRNTVRGYRENSLVRDEGSNASVEWRIPYIRREFGNRHELALFADYGSTKNVDRETRGTKNISSVGLGLIGQLNTNWRYQLYWAESMEDLATGNQNEGLENLVTFSKKDLQDDGVHFSMGYRW